MELFKITQKNTSKETPNFQSIINIINKKSSSRIKTSTDKPNLNEDLILFKCTNCMSTLFSNLNLNYISDRSNQIDYFIPEVEKDEKCLYFLVDESIKECFTQNLNVYISETNICCKDCKFKIGALQIDEINEYTSFEYIKIVKELINGENVKTKSKYEEDVNIKIYDEMRLKEYETLKKIYQFIDYFNKNIKPFVRSSLLRFKDSLEEIIIKLESFVMESKLDIHVNL